MTKLYELTGATTYATLKKTYKAGIQYPETEVLGLLKSKNSNGKLYFTEVGEIGDLELVGLEGDKDVQLTATEPEQEDEEKTLVEMMTDELAEGEQEPVVGGGSEAQPETTAEEGEPEVEEEASEEAQEPKQEEPAKGGVTINKKRGGKPRNTKNAVTI